MAEVPQMTGLGCGNHRSSPRQAWMATRQRFRGGTVAWLLMSLCGMCAQTPRPNEYQVKAAYLYNFGKFVNWPAKVSSYDDAFLICVLGEDPFGPTLDETIAGAMVNGKKVALRRITRSQDAVNCQILFVSSSEDGQLKTILAALDKTSILTVSDMPQFTQRGGMIQFVIDQNRVRFEVNLATAERAGLVLSSQLLNLAINVRRGLQAGG